MWKQAPCAACTPFDRFIFGCRRPMHIRQRPLACMRAAPGSVVPSFHLSLPLCDHSPLSRRVIEEGLSVTNVIIPNILASHYFSLHERSFFKHSNSYPPGEETGTWFVSLHFRALMVATGWVVCFLYEVRGFTFVLQKSPIMNPRCSLAAPFAVLPLVENSLPSAADTA